MRLARAGQIVWFVMGAEAQPDTSFMSAGEVRLLSLKDVERITSLKKSAIYALMAKSEFPQSVQITARRKGWFSHEVQAWVRSRLRVPAVMPGSLLKHRRERAR